MFGDVEKLLELRVQILGHKGKQKYHLYPSTTIEEFKQMICSKNDISISTVRLLYEGCILMKGKTLQDFQLHDGSIIYCVPKSREPPSYLPILFNINVPSITPQVYTYRAETRDFDRQLGNFRFKTALIQENAMKIINLISNHEKIKTPADFQDHARNVAGIVKRYIEKSKELIHNLEQYTVIDNHGHPGATFQRNQPLIEPPQFSRNEVIEHVIDGLGDLFGSAPNSNLIPRTVFKFGDLNINQTQDETKKKLEDIEYSLMIRRREFYQTERNAPIPTTTNNNFQFSRDKERNVDSLYPEQFFSEEDKNIMEEDRILIDELTQNEKVPRLSSGYFKTRIYI